MTPKDELLSMTENILGSEQTTENILEFLNLGCFILLIFIIVILIVYNLFAIRTFIKEQILIFLLDVRYKLLIDKE